jgi:hypothetical protein
MKRLLLVVLTLQNLVYKILLIDLVDRRWEAVVRKDMGQPLPRWCIWRVHDQTWFRRLHHWLDGYYRATVLRIDKLSYGEHPIKLRDLSVLQQAYHRAYGREEPPSGDDMWSGDVQRPAYLSKEEVDAFRVSSKLNWEVAASKVHGLQGL